MKAFIGPALPGIEPSKQLALTRIAAKIAPWHRVAAKPVLGVRVHAQRVEGVAVADAREAAGVKDDGTSVSAEKLFEMFLKENHRLYPEKGKGKRNRLSDGSARLYRTFWLALNRHLTEKCGGVHWSEASADQVNGFLSGLRPRSRREERRTDVGTRKTSPVTRQRYEMVLNRIYAYAMQLEQFPALVRVPVTVTNPEHLESRELVDSFFLHEGYRRMVVDAIDLKAEGHKARDSATLALMALEGLTTQELINLQCSDVDFGLGAPRPGWGDFLERWEGAPEPLAIEIRRAGSGKRDSQERRLVLSARSRKALRQWLEWRGPYTTQGARHVLLCGPRGQLSSTTIYDLAKEHLSRVLLGTPEKPGPESVLLHMGPMTLRTAAIMKWIEEIEDVDKVLQRAGLTFARSLKRFHVHASPEAKQRLTAALLKDGDRAAALARVDEEAEATA